MLRKTLIAAGALLIAGVATAQSTVEDPYLWLEEIQCSRALDQLLQHAPTLTVNTARI